MITELLLILLQSAIPIGITSFGLVWWAQRQDYLGGAASMSEYERWKKTENQSRKAEKKLRKEARRNSASKEVLVPAEEVSPASARKFDPLHSKWMKFGGGFYGVVALFTYALIELVEVRDFLVNLPNLFEHGFIQLIISFFIESFKNFIVAISWPAYWLDRVDSQQWMWVIGAYAGYWLGSNAAFRYASRRIEE